MSVKNNLSPTKTYVDQQLLKYDISKSKSSKAHQVGQEHFSQKQVPIQTSEKKRPQAEVIDLCSSTGSNSLHSAKKRVAEMKLSFLYGSNDHLRAYAKAIDEAQGHVIMASWNLNFIPQEIFSSLMNAKRRGVAITFVVQSVKHQETLQYFDDNEASFSLFITKSHAKFLFVDSVALVLGSYNALGDAYEESYDASVFLKGTINQLWPFYMSIYETYTSIGEDLRSIFDGIAMISKVRNPGPRTLLQRSFADQSKITLLRTIQEHEDFLRLATPHNGDVSIYSPFSTKDNTFKRLQGLGKLLPATVKVTLKVLPKFQSGLTRLLSLVPELQNRVTIETAPSHQKIVILGNETLCVGSLNWLSAAQDSDASYSNAEFSVVLQGPKAAKIIKKFYGASQPVTHK